MKEKIIFYRRDPVLTPVKEVMEKVKEFFPSSFTVVNCSLEVVFCQDNFVVFLDQTDLNVFTYTIAVGKLNSHKTVFESSGKSLVDTLTEVKEYIENETVTK